jgi:phage recombination protein Bet
MSTVAEPLRNGSKEPEKKIDTKPAVIKTDAERQPPLVDREVCYVPIGSDEEIKLSVNLVKRFLVTPTKNGLLPDDAEIIKFMMLCKAQRLNPWDNDVWLLGYEDRRTGEAKWSLVTSMSSIMKRAEGYKEFDGVESGVVVMKAGAEEPTERPGSIILPGESLVGGWARCHRKDRKHHAYASVNLVVYDKGVGRWGIDPGGMIQKVAKVASVREGFPMLNGMYERSEFDLAEPVSDQAMKHAENTTKIKTSADLAGVLKDRNAKAATSIDAKSGTNPLFAMMVKELESANAPNVLDSIEEDIRCSPDLDESQRAHLQKIVDDKRA